MKDRVDAFIDWENIRQRLADNYVEKVSIDQVMDAIRKVATEIGELRLASFYGDFTLRREEAKIIESKTHFRIRNVLRLGKDQTDAVLITELVEAILTSQDFDSILLCSGDSHYCEPVRKASLKGRKIYIFAVGLDVSPYLTSLAPLYPVERYLNVQLTRKVADVQQQTLAGLSPRDVSRWAKFVSILASMESKLPFVAISYFHKNIMLSYGLGGQTQDDRNAFLEEARESGIINIEEIDNPVRLGYKMRVIKLNRGNLIVKEILARN